MDAYTYVNQIIDGNSCITRMVFPSSVFAVVMGAVPAGQPAIPSRITCEEGDGTATATAVYSEDLFLTFVAVTA